MAAKLRKNVGVIGAGALLLLALVWTLAPMGAALAADAGAAAPAATPAAEPASAPATWGWGQTLKAMGICGYIIVALSVAGLALIIEFAVNLRRDKLIPPHAISELEQLFEQEQYEQAMELCEAEDSFFTRILGAGLAKLGAGYDRMVEAVQEAGEEELTAVNHKIGYLALIGTIAPMLGLLGTVIGMIESFAKIASMGGAANPVDLAAGISKALVTTFEGLIVAIPVMSAYNFFKNRATRIMLETGMIIGDLMDRFRPAQ